MNGQLGWDRVLGVMSLTVILLGGCTVGPKYAKPTTQVPSDYKETGADFKQAQPRDQIAKGKWWEIYDDSQLNSLEEQINVSNQTLKAQQARFQEARAAVRIARSQFFPNVTGGFSAAHNSESPNRPTGPLNLNYQDYVLPFECLLRTRSLGARAQAWKPAVRKPRPAPPTWRMLISAFTLNSRWTISNFAAWMHKRNCWIRPSFPIKGRLI